MLEYEPLLGVVGIQAAAFPHSLHHQWTTAREGLPHAAPSPERTPQEDDLTQQNGVDNETGRELSQQTSYWPQEKKLHSLRQEVGV